MNIIATTFLYKRSPVFYVLLAAICVANLYSQTQRKAFQGKIDRQHPDASIVLSQEHLDQIAQQFSSWKTAKDVVAHTPELRNKKITASQALTYASLKTKSPDIRIYFHERNGTPIFISGTKLGTAPLNAAPQTLREKNISTALSFLTSSSPLLKINEASMEFRPIDYQTDERGNTHIRFQQTYRGIDLWDKEVYVHLDRFGNITLFNGRYEPTPALITAPAAAINSDNALAISLTDISKTQDIKSFTDFEKKILSYNGPAAAKVIFCDYESGTPHLAYFVEVRPNIIDRLRYFIDAQSGAILFKYNSTCKDGPAKASAIDLNNKTQTIDTYLSGGQYFMIDATRAMFDGAKSVFPNNTVGTIWTINAQNSDLKNFVNYTSSNNTWSDKASVSAHYNAAQTYEYYRQTHNRNAIDDKGSTIISAVHVTEQNQPMDNAFWNGQLMAYGDGNQDFKSLAGGLDVGAHEMTHGVTEHSANLEYLFQSGALNESFSDMFAVMVDRKNFTLGEEIVIPSQYPSGALRNMADPHNGGTQGDNSWQPAHMNEFQNLTKNQDNGGVHINSGIPNKVCYLLSTAISREKTEKIQYCALTTKLTKQSQFIDCRLAFAKCAEEIYGANGAEVQAVKTAFDQVGILDASGTKGPGDIPAVNGPDKMLATSTDPTDPFSLWIITPPATNPNDFSSLTQTAVGRKPSVSDDGSIAVFVDGQKNLRVIVLDPAAPLEQIIDNSGIWNNAALSKDANLLSATTTLKDTSIYVFDVSTPNIRGKKFRLETPSYSNTSVPNTVQFADAMDFTFDKQYLLYDSYNEVTIAGVQYAFWEISALNIWDSAKKDFAAGDAQRIFPFEPDFSVGNPSIAKTKPTVFTFDTENPSAQTAAILAVDVNTGNMNKIADATYDSPGFPSYSGDDKIISFGTLDNSHVDIIVNVPIGSDGITATGSPALFISPAIYPVWFRKGTRPVAVENTHQPGETNVTLMQNYPNPFFTNSSEATTTIQYVLPTQSQVTLEVFDALGRNIKTLVNQMEEPGSHAVSFRAEKLLSGIYYYRLHANGITLTKKMIIVR